MARVSLQEGISGFQSFLVLFVFMKFLSCKWAWLVTKPYQDGLKRSDVLSS